MALLSDRPNEKPMTEKRAKVNNKAQVTDLPFEGPNDIEMKVFAY